MRSIDDTENQRVTNSKRFEQREWVLVANRRPSPEDDQSVDPEFGKCRRGGNDANRTYIRPHITEGVEYITFIA